MHFSLQDGQHGFLKEGTLCESAQNTVPRDCGWAPLTATHTRILASACTSNGRINLYKRFIVSTLAANNSLHDAFFYYFFYDDYFFHTSTIIIITSFHNYTIWVLLFSSWCLCCTFIIMYDTPTRLTQVRWQRRVHPRRREARAPDHQAAAACSVEARVAGTKGNEPWHIVGWRWPAHDRCSTPAV